MPRKPPKFRVQYIWSKTGKPTSYSPRKKLSIVVHYGTRKFKFVPAVGLPKETKQGFTDWLRVDRKRTRTRKKTKAAKKAALFPKLVKPSKKTKSTTWIPLEVEEQSFRRRITRRGGTLDMDPVFRQKDSYGLEVIDLETRFVWPDAVAFTPEAQGGKTWRVIKIWTVAYDESRDHYNVYSYTREISPTRSWDALMEAVFELEAERLEAAAARDYSIGFGLFGWTAYTGG